MKKSFAGTAALFVVVITLVFIFSLLPHHEPRPTTGSFQPETASHEKVSIPEKQNEKSGDPVLSNIPSPARPADTATADLKGGDNTRSLAPSEQLMPEGNPSPPALEKPDTLQPARTTPERPTDREPLQGMGLLTDTGETEENRISDPEWLQVQPTAQKNLSQKARLPSAKPQLHKLENIEVVITPDGTYPFTVLLETFEEQKNAQEALALYRQKGIEGFWVKVDLGPLGVKYRLFSGIFPSRAAAEDFLAQHRLHRKPIKKTSYAGYLGTYVNEKELEIAFRKAAEGHVFPYVLGSITGPFTLFVGAYYTADGADAQCRELEQQGFVCKAAQRATPYLSPAGQ